MEKSENSMFYGDRIYKLAKELYPFNRSLTGEGVRKTLEIIKKDVQKEVNVDFNIYEIASGEKVFDWTVPKEWKIRDAFIEDENGSRLIDFKKNNLHVLGYSIPVDKWVDLNELKECIYTQPDQPDWIPYVTSYYKERYGFCMSENMKSSLKKGRYHMYIDSELFDGVLNYAEAIIPGETDQEIFFSTYICHPSMANNECSGPALAAHLIKYVASLSRRKYTYRFVFVPENIGAIAYLSQSHNLFSLQKNMIAGFNLSCVGDDRTYSYIESKYANTLADKVLKNVLDMGCNGNYETYPFIQSGSDERRYNSAGIDLPVVGFCRSKYGCFPEYHTSADDMKLVSPNGFQGSYIIMTQVIQALEYNKKYRVKCKCEPQLGPRGLYPNISQKGSSCDSQNMMMVLYYSDGKSDLLDISNILKVSMQELATIVDKLIKADVLE